MRENMGHVLNAIGQQVDKKEQKGAKCKNPFPFLFLKTIKLKVIIIIKHFAY